MWVCRWREGGLCLYLVPGLALSDLGLERVDLVLGLLQLADTLTCSTLVLAELPPLLVNQPLKDAGTEQRSTRKKTHGGVLQTGTEQTITR